MYRIAHVSPKVGEIYFTKYFRNFGFLEIPYMGFIER